jgi:hypothetical protein
MDNGTEIVASNTDRPFPITRLDSVVIESNTFVNTERAINMSRCFGFGCDTLSAARNTVIAGNTFLRTDTLRPTGTAIVLAYHDAPVISGNDISGSGTGISLSQAPTNYRIVGNRLDLVTPENGFGATTTASAIDIGFVQSAPPFGLIANNMIRLRDPVRQDTAVPNLFGIGVGQSKNVFLLYNTVLIEDSASTSHALNIAFGSDSITALNNILVNDGGGPATRIKFIERFNSTFNLDYNLLFTTGDTIAVWNDTGRTDLDQVRPILSGSEEHSLVARPTFVSGTDLHLVPASIGIALGFPVPDFVPDDIDGDIRSFEAPDIGADEVVTVSVEPAGTVGQLVENGLRLVPNPASGSLHCTATGGSHLTGQYEIVSASGVICIHGEFEIDDADLVSWHVHLENLPAGIYWIRVPVSSGPAATKRFVIAR